jgi:hypothetical protein
MLGGGYGHHFGHQKPVTREMNRASRAMKVVFVIRRILVHLRRRINDHTHFLLRSSFRPPS